MGQEVFALTESRPCGLADHLWSGATCPGVGRRLFSESPSLRPGIPFLRANRLVQRIQKPVQVLVVGALLALPVGAVADSQRQATAEMQKGNYAIAYHLWRVQAETGDAESCYNLGWMYHNGYGLVIDDRQAERYWQLAASRDHSGAMFALGNLYSLGGEGVVQDYGRAVEFWARAAEQGNSDANRALLDLASREMPEVDALFADLLARDPLLFDTTGRIGANRVNLRDGPGKDNGVIEVLNHNRPVIELLRRGDWVKVGVANPARLGWVYSKLIREVNKASPANSKTGH